jgi:hypothetical protein
MSLLKSFATPLQTEGCVALGVAVEAVEINIIITRFESSFFSGSCHHYGIIG